MPAVAKDRQISVRIAREREQELLAMFDEAAQDLTADDLEERESLLGGWSPGGRAVAGIRCC
jgi:hypothetical protein